MKDAVSVQPSFQGYCPIEEAVERLAVGAGIEERGAVYTKREVVEFILDLVGYTEDQTLADFCLLEPSFGDGDFIIPIVDRLLKSTLREAGELTYERLAPAIRGVELHRETFARNRSSVRAILLASGLNELDAEALLDIWLIQGDFLLCEFDQIFTHTVGNPPYIRQEMVPDVLMAEYRQRYSTIYDRADIYVPFIEQSLSLLKKGGKLGFICADRWMKNRYGKKLREHVSRDFVLSTYVDMVGTDAFQTEVSAYPAITVIERKCTQRSLKNTRVFAQPEINTKALKALAKELTSKTLRVGSTIHEFDSIVAGSEPWLLEDFEALALVRCLEAKFPTLEQAGCKVGIGVATGADSAFIGQFDELDVEPCRKVPLAMTKDILEGHVVWQGRGVVNPFGEDGKLVRLEDFPRLKRYLDERHEKIARRHVATKSPQNWYRTIDRIYPDLAAREKLLIPDIKGDASIVYEPGKLYPHHNLYYVTSEEWDAHALQAVLRSGIARLFVALYSTKMRGGYLRFQAQYLRRIRLPRWETVNDSMRERLQKVSQTHDRQELNDIVANLYGISRSDMALIEGGKVV